MWSVNVRVRHHEESRIVSPFYPPEMNVTIAAEAVPVPPAFPVFPLFPAVPVVPV